jgi:hypothetical protein
MELLCEGPAQNGAGEDAIAFFCSIGIINNPETHPAIHIYLDFQPFSPNEIKQFIGLYKV